MMFEYLDDDHIPHPLYKVTLDFGAALTGDVAQGIADAIEELGVSVFMKNTEATDGDNWTVELTSYGEPDLDAIFVKIEEFSPGLIARENITAEKLPEKDWLRHVHDNFPPVVIGRFFVYGSHYTGDRPDHLTPLKIDAATAFGSGEHETTKGCMMAFEHLKSQGFTPESALDMGCGSGILAIAMVKIWPGLPVAAVDIDPESIIVTERHAAMNDVSTIKFEAGDGYVTPLAQNSAPYDLIAANILAGPLIDMAPQLNAVLKPKGYAVLSGLLARQEKDVIAAHEKQGLRLVKSIEINDWRALLLQKG